MTQPQKLEERPPFISFETVSVENREASIKEGHYVGHDIDMAYITPAGSKDRIERVVSDWFPQLKLDKEAGRISPAWVDYYEAAYAAFKKGQSVPVNGTPIKDWPGLSPTQFKMLTSLHLLAIEDVAAANEETIARMGMGGRSLKQRAADYLSAAQNVGKVAEQASAMREELAGQRARNDTLEEQVRQMAGQLQALTAAQASIGAGQAVTQPGISASDILDGPGEKL